jgi:uncharacterized membrane protein YvbJ
MNLPASNYTHYCQNCGHRVEPGSQYCTNCGTRIDLSTKSDEVVRRNDAKSSFQSVSNVSYPPKY